MTLSIAAEFDQDEKVILLKVATNDFEVNVRLRADEVPTVRRAASTSWLFDFACNHLGNRTVPRGR